MIKSLYKMTCGKITIMHLSIVLMTDRAKGYAVFEVWGGHFCWYLSSPYGNQKCCWKCGVGLLECGGGASRGWPSG